MGGLQVIIVSVHVLYDSFTPIYVEQDRLSGTQVYVSLCRFTLDGRDVELNKKKGKIWGYARNKTGTK